MRVRVAIINGSGQADRCPEFTKPEITIGRRPNNDIVIPDASASSAHARVMVTGGALTILDLDSTNGTYVNAQPLQGPRMLETGDRVTIGDYHLEFTLDGVAERRSSSSRALSKADRGAEPQGGNWPAPPPMMDDVASAPTAIAASVPGGHPNDDVGAVRSALFPSLPPSSPPTPVPTPAPTSYGAEGYEFRPAPPAVLVDRVFRAVQGRFAVAIERNEAGLADRIDASLEAALDAAGQVAELGDTTMLRERMGEEMVGDGTIPELIAGEPDELIVVGTTRVRVRRAGHVSEGPSPFSCPAAIESWVRRVCGADEDGPVRRGSYGPYTVRAVREASGTVLCLRRMTATGAATLEALVHGGILSHGVATLLSACVVSRLNVLLAVGPGANAQPIMAALMACGSPSEQQVMLGHADLSPSLFPPTTILLTRDGLGDQAVTTAQSLGPDRLAIDEMQGNEMAAVAAIVARSTSHVLGVRAASGPLALELLESMLCSTTPRPAARQLLTQSIDVVLTVQMFADAVTRVASIAEPALTDDGELMARDIFALAPGSRTWQFSGITPRCFEDITRRGFPLDPAIFA